MLIFVPVLLVYPAQSIPLLTWLKLSGSLLEANVKIHLKKLGSIERSLYQTVWFIWKKLLASQPNLTTGNLYYPVWLNSSDISKS